MMAAINFANACMSVSAQPDCAAFACPATTNIAIILDVSLLLASILICLLVKGNRTFPSQEAPPDRRGLFFLPPVFHFFVRPAKERK